MQSPLDLAAYFARIGYHPPANPSADVLSALTAAHAQSIPFENIDVLLGRPIQLETGALFHKLVTARRGGYCFEQNGLFMAVLRQLGFNVRPLSARVRLGAPNRDVVVPRTHLVLEVRIDGEAWITDVGVGSASLTRALRWIEGAEQATAHDTRRLVRDAGRWFHQIRRDNSWMDVYEFTGETMPLIDRTVANWYTSTHPDSKFRRQLSVALALPNGRRASLLDRELTVRERDGSAQKTLLQDPAALLDVLGKTFGIHLPRGTRLNLPDIPQDRDA